MERIWIYGSKEVWLELEEWRREAERTGQYRVARRAHAVQLNWEGWTTTQIAQILHVGRVSVIRWLHHWQDLGLEGLLEGQHSGRPPLLSEAQRQMLADLIDSGPIAYGFLCGVWTSPMVARVIEEEFGIAYHPGHVRKLLQELGFSVQRPRRKLVRADPEQQRHWARWIYPSLKREARAEGAALIFTDEATFRVDPTLYQTWARVGQQPQIPTTGKREAEKIFSAVNLFTCRFTYRHDAPFNAQTYLGFLEQIVRKYAPQKVRIIHDRASYHKDDEVGDWLREHRRHIQAHLLPPYSPEFNPMERVWHHVRLNGTHNRYFRSREELRDTLTREFRSIQSNPAQIDGYLRPYR